MTHTQRSATQNILLWACLLRRLGVHDTLPILKSVADAELHGLPIRKRHPPLQEHKRPGRDKHPAFLRESPDELQDVLVRRRLFVRLRRVCTTAEEGRWQTSLPRGAISPPSLATRAGRTWYTCQAGKCIASRQSLSQGSLPERGQHGQSVRPRGAPPRFAGVMSTWLETTRGTK
jgi:hypothetical protein